MSVTTLIGIVIILIQSGLDMASEGLDTGITYIVIYVVLMGLLWYFNFRPIKLDNYSRLSSPTLATNVRQKRIEEGDLLRKDGPGEDDGGDRVEIDVVGGDDSTQFLQHPVPRHEAPHRGDAAQKQEVQED